MKLFRKSEPTPDPRDMTGQNPTGRERRSSGRSRRRAARSLERDLDGWTPEEGDE
jgi:hypothetical protein